MNQKLTMERVDIMKKKIISDIRLYRSESQNEYGVYATKYFAEEKLNAIVQRVVMKLREYEFSLGEFDHLYINFTTCDIGKKTILSDYVDKYHPWYRYCLVHIEKDTYDKLDSIENYDYIVQWIRNILVTYFSSQDFDETRILSCFQQAVDQSENMLMKFKEKISTNRKAVIFLRYLDSCKFHPLLRVYDAEDNLLFEKDLPEAVMLDYLGDIQVSPKRVTIKPRKNAFTAQVAPLVFEY
jgi:hypothetical protein